MSPIILFPPFMGSMNSMLTSAQRICRVLLPGAGSTAGRALQKTLETAVPATTLATRNSGAFTARLGQCWRQNLSTRIGYSDFIRVYPC